MKNIVLFVKTLPSLNRCFAENTAPRGFLSIMSSYKPQRADKECIFVLAYTFDTLCSFCSTFTGRLFWLL